jgi:hypothetical protein
MSTIIGANNNPLVSFTLNPGEPARIWWWGFGPDGVGYNIGSAFPSSLYTVSNRVVTDNNGMEWVDWAGPSGVLYTVDLHAEDSQGTGNIAAFRIQIGQLS